MCGPNTYILPLRSLISHLPNQTNKQIKYIYSQKHSIQTLLLITNHKSHHAIITIYTVSTQASSLIFSYKHNSYIPTVETNTSYLQLKNEYIATTYPKCIHSPRLHELENTDVCLNLHIHSTLTDPKAHAATQSL